MPAVPSPRPLRPGTRLLHVGPLNTGADVLQRTLHQNRGELAAHNVWLPWPDRDADAAVRGGLGVDAAEESLEAWRRLVADVPIAGDRIAVVSSERFADADDEQAAALVDRLGGEDVHIAITLRPLVDVLPYWWQDAVLSGLSVKYERWLEHAFDREGGNAVSWRWNRQRHAQLLDRWIAATGPERVTVLVVDDGYRRRVVGGAERLLGIPEGTLDLAREWDRRLTAAEIEFVRLCFDEFRRRRLPRSVYRDFLVDGGIARMREQRVPVSGKGFTETPLWAKRRAVEIGGALVDHIQATGVSVAGELELLRGAFEEDADPLSDLVDEKPEPELHLTPEAAAKAMLGVLEQVIEAQRTREQDPDGACLTGPTPTRKEWK